MNQRVVAIIGRQNVGKSTLLNRLAGHRISITEDLPGTTRDRIAVTISWQGREFTLVDTGGLEMQSEGGIARRVREQVTTAIAEADVILFVVDAKDGVTPPDQEVADMLRRANKPVLLVVNKADNPQLEAGAAVFYQLGFGDPLPISAYHGRGTIDLLDKITAMLPETPPAEVQENIIKVAIVGRPNVGKSMLLNALVGEERVIVDETPGTTRDSVDTLVDFQGQSVLFIDTAGIRRPGRVEEKVERYSVGRAMQSIERADIALLVTDATEPLTAQDLHIAGYVQEAAKGIILVVNKWDLVKGRDTKEYERYIRSRLKFMPYTPVLFTSAMFGQGVDKIMSLVRQVYDSRLKRVPSAAVNSIVREAFAAQTPPRTGRKQLKVYKATQTAVNPPTFAFYVNEPKLVHFSYQRYLENRLRQAFGFVGTPLRLVFKAGGGA